MANDINNSPENVRGRPFQKGRSGNPAGRRSGSRNKATLAAARLLAGEAERLTRRTVEAAFAGDPMALRLCVERLLPVCRERPVKFKLPPIESPADTAAAMKAACESSVILLTSPSFADRRDRVGCAVGFRGVNAVVPISDAPQQATPEGSGYAEPNL